MVKEYFMTQRATERSYSQAVKVKGGHTVYLAGVVNRDAKGNQVPGEFSVQARTAFDRLRDAVELAGGTLDDIVNMTVFLTDSRYGDEFVKIRSEYFKGGHYPASTLITASALAFPWFQIEIQAVAVLDE
jgi:2-iminobutanoate/2-iminopropanoate deaminase